LIFRKESVEATFSLDEKTDLRCIAKNIDEAKKMAQEYSGKPLILVARKIVLGCKNRGSIAIVNKPCFATNDSEKKCRVVVRNQKE